ncbi:MAG: glycerol-3-phosphate 1-O-acyltransferase PlsY [Thermodesulfobacteriota bacterium]
MAAILFLAVAYLLGSIPFGALLVRWKKGADIRTLGSGNIGATNVLRTSGPALGGATLLLDAGKAALPAACALLLFGTHSPVPALAVLAAFLGHLYPAYTRFTGGGKGVATAAGGMLVLCPPAIGLAFVVFCLCLLLFRRVSVASMVGAAIMALTGMLAGYGFATAMAGVVMAALIVLRHKENLLRLRQGTEPKIF